jgi:hypothetical protein
MDTVDFTKFCLLTGVRENLGTKMDIEHEGKSYKIAICDSASEEASLKVIRTRLAAVLIEMEALIARAKDFGLFISFVQSTKRELVAVGATAPDQPAVVNGKHVETVVENIELEDVDGNKQKFEVPNKIKDRHGTTDIKFVKTDNKAVLEQVAKYNHGDHSYAMKGYGSEAKPLTCTPCRGLGIVRMKSSTPKHCVDCGGSGNIKGKEGTSKCKTCTGSGSVFFNQFPCKKCGGLGLLNT